MIKIFSITHLQKTFPEELPYYSKWTRNEILKNEFSLFSLVPEDYEDENFEVYRPLLSLITTYDGKEVYICKAKIVLACSYIPITDAILEHLTGYIKGTHIDISWMAGKTFCKKYTSIDPLSGISIPRRDIFTFPTIQPDDRLIFFST